MRGIWFYFYSRLWPGLLVNLYIGIDLENDNSIPRPKKYDVWAIKRMYITVLYTSLYTPSIYTTGKNIEYKHNENTRIWHSGLLEMAWYETKTSSVTLTQFSRFVLRMKISTCDVRYWSSKI